MIGALDGDWAVLLGGSGERSWTAIGGALGARGAGSAWGIPADAVRGRLCLELPPDPPAARDAARAFLRRIDGALDRGLGVAGYLGYEVGAALEGIAACRPGTSDEPSAAELVVFPVQAVRSLQLPPARTPAIPPDGAPVRETLGARRVAFESAVRQALAGIRRGSIYQVNLTERAPLELPVELRRAPLPALLARLLAVQPVPCAMGMQTRRGRLLSGSMERFLHVRDGVREGGVRSRPIKGTRPRGRGPAEDLVLRAELVDSAKERAENLMIVDMVRNDLSRVCRAGSVTVPTLLQAVPYCTLWHLESEVRGRLEPGVSAAALLAATLPPASVSGCPKVSAMRWIARLEARPRGPYCGALGAALPGGVHDWSVGIRTAWLGPRAAWIEVGAGIVAASDPCAEFEELVLKAVSATAALGAPPG